ncbi:MAG TPA: hypothetical protein VFW03_19150 [Gemmatimonadaceae bacterium]|nr:hypothetical protein [Gemmatimonadaceae bacterium]
MTTPAGIISAMRLTLFAAAIVAAATPLAAQQPERLQTPAGAVVRGSPDPITATILRAAATDTADKIASYLTKGDTMWAVLVNTRTMAAREVRLERRGARASWARVSEKPVPLPSPARPQWVGDTAVAPAMQLEPPKKKKP